MDRIVTHRINSTKKSVLLLGPRQVGKSTLIRRLSPDIFIDLADEQLFLRYSKDPGIFTRELSTKKGPHRIAVDEVQRIPQLLNSIQSLIDRTNGDFRFLLTGSSARKLRERNANLLPGRVLHEFLDPLTLFEAGEAFNLEWALQVGMLPGIFFDQNEGHRILGSYVETYLREEIKAESLARDIGAYARFIDVMAILSGQWLNYSKIASDTEIPKETIRRYVGILEDTLLAFRIPSFQPRTKLSRRISQRDRIVLFDVGVRNAILGYHRAPLPRDQVGSVFEQWLLLQCLYLNRAFQKDWRISSYRTEGGAEVDIVIETEKEIIGIEVKSGQNVGANDFRGLESLSQVIKKYKPFKRWIAYTGTIAQRFDQGEVLPYEMLLAMLRDY